MVHPYQHVQGTQEDTRIINQKYLTQSNLWKTGRTYKTIHTLYHQINVQIIRGHRWHVNFKNVLIMTPYETDKPFTTLINQINKGWKFTFEERQAMSEVIMISNWIPYLWTPHYFINIFGNFISWIKHRKHGFISTHTSCNQCSNSMDLLWHTGHWYKHQW